MKAFAATVRQIKSAGRVFYRVVVAHANRAQFDIFSGEYVQSFAPMYRVFESGDYVNMPDAIRAQAIATRGTKFNNIAPDHIDWY
jgi:hypothetical protein